MNTKPFAEPIYVSRPMLPNLDTLKSSLEEVWNAKWLTNMGAKHQELERLLRLHLQVSNLSLLNNGTIALLIALKALRLKGEVITTPFTFAATPHCIAWQGLTPIFSDIDPKTLTLDLNKVEDSITDKTSAILGVHVYGQPCDVHGIDTLAKKYDLKVIYDAAHAFDVKIGDRGIGSFGDITMFSFHATKLFHTAEGGCLTTEQSHLKKEIDLLKNFGIENEDTVSMVGINGKLSEINSAIGLETLKLVQQEKDKRTNIFSWYKDGLRNVPGVNLFTPEGVSQPSMQYLVARISPQHYGRTRDELYSELRRFNIIARKYFSPLCSNFECYKDNLSARVESLPVANDASSSVLALPFYGELTESDVSIICSIIKDFSKKR